MQPHAQLNRQDTFRYTLNNYILRNRYEKKNQNGIFHLDIFYP